MKFAIVLSLFLQLTVAWSIQRRHGGHPGKKDYDGSANKKHQYQVEQYNSKNAQPADAKTATNCTEATTAMQADRTSCNKSKTARKATTTICDETSDQKGVRGSGKRTTTVTPTTTTTMTTTVTAPGGAQSYATEDNGGSAGNGVMPTPMAKAKYNPPTSGTPEEQSNPNFQVKAGDTEVMPTPIAKQKYNPPTSGAPQEQSSSDDQVKAEPVESSASESADQKPRGRGKGRGKSRGYKKDGGDSEAGASSKTQGGDQGKQSNLERDERKRQQSATPPPSNPEAKAPTTPTTPSAGSKRGILIDNSVSSTWVKALNANPGKISWAGNWFSKGPDDLTPKINFVPQMYRGTSDDSKPNEAPHPWTTNADKAVQAGQKYFLSFGEPNTNGTADGKSTYMSPQTGAETFMKYMNRYAVQNGVRIGSPGTLGSPLDLGWQNDFLDACAGLGCKIGFVGCHWVSPCGDASAQKLADTFWGTVEDYKAIARKHSNQYGGDLKVWVDNFGMTCGDAKKVRDFLEIVVPKLEQDEMIEKYMFVSFDWQYFVDGSGGMTELGKRYADM